MILTYSRKSLQKMRHTKLCRYRRSKYQALPLSAIVCISPYDHSLGPSTGGRESRLKSPPNRVVGSRCWSFITSARILFTASCMTISLRCDGDGEIGR